jgi:SAM-dependent methyltransferase
MLPPTSRQSVRLACDRGSSAEPDGEARFLEAAERLGWRRAAEGRFADAPRRVTVAGTALDFLPIPDGSLILDATAGYGRLAAELAQLHHVVALTPNPAQARFLGIRKRQDGLHHLSIVVGDPLHIAFARAQFRAAVVAPTTPEDLGGADLFTILLRVKELLVPGGLLYLGIGNRYGWRNFNSALAPKQRPVAPLQPCGLLGYRAFFREAGLELLSMWLSLVGEGDPSILIALNRKAIADALYRNYGGPFRHTRRFREFLDRTLAVPWLWRLAGNHYSFLLRVKDA